MFSLKFDLLFPSFDAAKSAAKKLNNLMRSPAPPADVREYKRTLDEIRGSREKAFDRAMGHRNLFL